MVLAEDSVVNSVMVHSYFASVKAGFWSLKHYIDWICKDSRELPQWETCLTAFYNSLAWIVEQRSISYPIRVIANRITKARKLPETRELTENLRMMYERIYNGKYGNSIYETMVHVQKNIVHVQKEEEIFASAVEMHSKKLKTKSGNQRLNDGDLNEEFTNFPPSEDNEDNDSSLCQESSSIPIDANDNHELNQRQASYYESASDDNYSKDNGKKKYQNLLLLTREHREIIENIYNNMKKERMWKLSTGKYVEEELFNLGKKLKSEHAVHSFILDVDDEIIRHHFSEVELNEIDSVPSPQAPELSDDITDCLTKFAGKTNLKEIREIIKDLMLGNEYDHKKHHDIDYVIFAIYALVREIQSESLKDDNLESWFNCHIWSVVFDQAFGDLKTISVVRGESASLASGSRKNAERKSTEERRKMGRRGDWILRSITSGDKQEFGAGEAGKHWVDEKGTKLLMEAGLKLPKVLKDMLLHLMKKADWNKEQCAKIQTVGLIHAGLMIMTVFLDSPKGYVCRIQRGELMEVPDSEENFPSILTILASALNIKAVVQETIKAVQSKEQSAEFKRAGFRKRSRNEDEFQMPSCLSTPKKVKVCIEAYTEKSYPSSPCPSPSCPGSELSLI